MSARKMLLLIDLSNPAASRTQHSGLSQSAKVRLGSPHSSKALSLCHSSSSKKEIFSVNWICSERLPLKEGQDRGFTGDRAKYPALHAKSHQLLVLGAVASHSQDKMRLISPDERSGHATTAVWSSLVAQNQAVAALWRATANPEVGTTAEAGAPCVGPAGGLQWYPSAAASPSLPACSGKAGPCLFVTERVLKQQKNPRQLCFSAALLMTRWPPVNTIRFKGGYKGHVTRTQLP